MSITENSVLQSNSHHYTLKEMGVGGTGLKLTGKVISIPLVRGSKIEGENKIDKQDGVLPEQLLTVCKAYLEAVNVGDFRNRNTAIAITKLEEALMWLNKRTEERRKKGILGTYKN